MNKEIMPPTARITALAQHAELKPVKPATNTFLNPPVVKIIGIFFGVMAAGIIFIAVVAWFEGYRETRKQKRKAAKDQEHRLRILPTMGSRIRNEQKILDVPPVTKPLLTFHQPRVGVLRPISMGRAVGVRRSPQVSRVEPKWKLPTIMEEEE